MTIDSTFDQPTIHDSLPSGFSFANRVQREVHEDLGYVPGARKLCVVRTAEGNRLAVRLGPPTGTRRLRERGYVVRDAYRAGVDNPYEVTGGLPSGLLDWYVREYNAGFAAGHRHVKGGPIPAKWADSSGSAAWDDGYLDGKAWRAKWHLAHCTDHDACGEA